MSDGSAVAVVLTEGDAEGDGVAVVLTEGDAEGDGVAVALTDGEGVALAEEEGLAGCSVACALRHSVAVKFMLSRKFPMPLFPDAVRPDANPNRVSV